MRTCRRPICPRKSGRWRGRKDAAEQTMVKSLYLGDGELEAHNWRLHAKYELLAANETRFEGLYLDDAELVVTAFGSAARIAHTAVRLARAQGLKVGLLRPITLFPFPKAAFRQATAGGRKVLSIELNTGQMVEDVRLSVDAIRRGLFLRPSAGCRLAADAGRTARADQEILRG